MGVSSPSAEDIIDDARWLAHRYDDSSDMVRFRFVERAHHVAITFLTDAELGAGDEVAIPRSQLLGPIKAKALRPAGMICHSAFCCSTLLARALDVPGKVTAYKEPQILNDVIGLQLRGGDPRQVAAALDIALLLLDRPLGDDQHAVIKPSNVINPLLKLALHLRPQARMIALYAPLTDYLGSVARKEVEGRAWVRELAWKFERLGMMRRFGYSDEEWFRHTDLQIAALGWLAQHAEFAELASQQHCSVVGLSSDELMAAPEQSVARVITHLSLPLDPATVAGGKVFHTHSKTGGLFDADARRAERESGLATHAREVDVVSEWARRTAEHVGISLTLPSASA